MKRILLLIACSLLAALFLVFPDSVRQSAESALAMCVRSLIPSLFPFFVLSNFIINAGLIPPSPMLLGAIGGYPLGAAIICNLYKSGSISKAVAERQLPACSLCGVGFMLGAVGAVFGDFKTALLLWGIHLLTGLLLGLYLPKIKALPTDSLPLSASFTKGVNSALSSCLNICAFVVFFSILSSFLPSELSGVLEMSRGVFSAKGTRLGACLVSFYTAFGGLCVQAQVAALCAEAGLSPRRHFYLKFLHGILASVLTFFVK